MTRRRARGTGAGEEGGPAPREDRPGPAVDAGATDLRRAAEARRRLEQYLEARSLDRHLREVFYDKGA